MIPLLTAIRILNQHMKMIRSSIVNVLACTRPKRAVSEDSLAFGGRGIGITRALRFSGGKTIKFDSTLGFPGEGWTQLKLATWNTRSLTFERYNYCLSLNYDVLVITELWRNQQRFQTKSTRFTASSPLIITKGARKGQVRFPHR